MGTGIERIVLDFVHAAYGEQMDVEAMTALMAEDFVWQLMCHSRRSSADVTLPVLSY